MKTISEYLRRIGKARGFGIQSPWAYRVVTEVIGEKTPYYCYEDIDREYKTRSERKFQKLLFRIRNFVYPHNVDVVTTEDLHDNTCIRRCSPNGALIVKGIYDDREAEQRWRQFVARNDVGIVFDLYHYAICFFDLDIHKQYYKLNF